MLLVARNNIGYFMKFVYYCVRYVCNIYLKYSNYDIEVKIHNPLMPKKCICISI